MPRRLPGSTSSSSAVWAASSHSPVAQATWAESDAMIERQYDCSISSAYRRPSRSPTRDRVVHDPDRHRRGRTECRTPAVSSRPSRSLRAASSIVAPTPPPRPPRTGEINARVEIEQLELTRPRHRRAGLVEPGNGGLVMADVHLMDRLVVAVVHQPARSARSMPAAPRSPSRSAPKRGPLPARADVAPSHHVAGSTRRSPGRIARPRGSTGGPQARPPRPRRRCRPRRRVHVRLVRSRASRRRQVRRACSRARAGTARTPRVGSKRAGSPGTAEGRPERLGAEPGTLEVERRVDSRWPSSSSAPNSPARAWRRRSSPAGTVSYRASRSSWWRKS